MSGSQSFLDDPVYWDSILSMPIMASARPYDDYWVNNTKTDRGRLPTAKQEQDENSSSSSSLDKKGKRHIQYQPCAECSKLVSISNRSMRCSYHRKRVEHITKTSAYSEESYAEKLMKLDTTMTRYEATVRSKNLFCPRHPCRKTRRRGLCSSCYKQYLKDKIS